MSRNSVIYDHETDEGNYAHKGHRKFKTQCELTFSSQLSFNILRGSTN